MEERSSKSLLRLATRPVTFAAKESLQSHVPSGVAPSQVHSHRGPGIAPGVVDPRACARA